MKLLLIVLVSVLAVGSSRADPVRFEGNFTQGGMAVGHTTPGSVVEFADRSIRVSPQGVFVIGFHRDDPAEMQLSVRLPDGTLETVELSVAQRDYEIQRIDGLPPKKVTPPEEVIERIQAEAALVRAARGRNTATTDFAGSWIWPADGPISGVFGSQRILNGQPRQPHYGVDIAAPEGAPFVAPADGVVSLVHRDMYFSGGTLMVDHGHGVQSTFLHLQTIAVQEGDVVRQGQVLGTVGATGRATAPHLDWRVNWFDKRLDAALLVPKRS